MQLSKRAWFDSNICYCDPRRNLEDCRINNLYRPPAEFCGVNFGQRVGEGVGDLALGIRRRDITGWWY